MIPSEEYDQRRVVRVARVAQFDKIHVRLGNVRLLLAACVVVLAWLAFGSHLLSVWWIAAPIVAFGGIAVWHSRVLRARDLAQRAVHSMNVDSLVFTIAGPAPEKPANGSPTRIMSIPATWIYLEMPACSS